MAFKKPALRLSLAAIAAIIVIGAALLTNGQYREVDKEKVISVEAGKQLESVIKEYYRYNQPRNKGALKNFNTKKYGSEYLVLTEKYGGEGHSFSDLFLIDHSYRIAAVTSGDMPISPCFSANIVKHQGRSIVYGNFKNKKWDPQTDIVSDVQIDSIVITFEDGTVIKEPVSMDRGYIIVADTISKIKNIEVNNSKGELQSDLLNDSFCSEYSFREVGNSTGNQTEKDESAKLLFDKDKVQEYWLETAVLHACPVKDGPGDSYKNIGNLRYGDIVYTSAKYNEWVECIENNGEIEYWVKSENLIDEQRHRDYNLGIIAAEEVTVGTITRHKGDLIQVLKRDKDKSCVTIRVIDVNGGKTGWISNSDYTMAKPDVFFNQAYLRKGTVIYKRPSLNAQVVECQEVKESDLFVFINKEEDGWMSVSSYGPIDGWVKKENVFIPMPLTSNESENAQQNEIKFANAFNGNLVSPSVPDKMKEKLRCSIASMKDMGPGVGPWRIIHCNGERIILYNYSHIIACDLTEKNKGIYSVIDLKDLKVGSYQGSVVARIYSSPDVLACIIGTGCWEEDYKDKTMSTYICNFNDGSVKELEDSFNMANSTVTWHRILSDHTLLPWYVSVKGNNKANIWDVEKTKKLDRIPSGTRVEAVDEKHIENIDLDTGYTYYSWWRKDDNTVIGAPYRKGTNSMTELKLGDIEIIEVNLKDKSGKVLYKFTG